MKDGPVIVSTIEAPEGRGWVEIKSGREPAERWKAVRVAIYSDGSLAVLVSLDVLRRPYWYAYWKAKGRTRSKYVGKKLPAALGDVGGP